MAKLIGYTYHVVQMQPHFDHEQVQDCDVIRWLFAYDDFNSAEDVCKALERNNTTPSDHFVLCVPRWGRDKPITKEEILAGPDWERVDDAVGQNLVWEKVEEELPDPPF